MFVKVSRLSLALLLALVALPLLTASGQSGAGSGTIYFYTIAESLPEVYDSFAFNVRTRQLDRVYYMSFNPAISPDGRYSAFVQAERENGRRGLTGLLSVLDLNSGRITQLIPNMNEFVQGNTIKWLSDNETVLFLMKTGNPAYNALFRVNIRDGGLTQLSPNGVDVTLFDVQTERDEVVYLVSPFAVSSVGLWRLDLSERDAQPEYIVNVNPDSLYLPSQYHVRNSYGSALRLQPFGDLALLHRWDLNPESGVEILLDMAIDLYTGQNRILLRDEYLISDAVWSNDGTLIAAKLRDKNSFQYLGFYLFTPDGDFMLQVLGPETWPISYVWSPTDEYIAFAYPPVAGDTGGIVFAGVAYNSRFGIIDVRTQTVITDLDMTDLEDNRFMYFHPIAWFDSSHISWRYGSVAGGSEIPAPILNQLLTDAVETAILGSIPGYNVAEMINTCTEDGILSAQCVCRAIRVANLVPEDLRTISSLISCDTLVGE